jgi:hypothetical protein
MSKEEIILDLVKSLNMGNSCSYDDRVNIAISQYDQMVRLGVICTHKRQAIPPNPEPKSEMTPEL